MPSNINVASLDANFPVAGTNNSSQGFRDNFTNIKTNLNYAKAELSDLQAKAILKSALVGQTLNNDMSETILSNVTLRSAGVVIEDLGEVAGDVNLNFATSTHYVMTTIGNISIAFTDWPSSGICGAIKLVINIGNAAHRITLPKTVSQGLNRVSSIETTLDNTGVIMYSVVSFSSPGVYVYNFETIDRGTKILILDQSRGIGSGSGSSSSVTLAPAALPTATSGRLGLVRVGSGLAITPEGTLSIDLTAANLPLGSASSIGGVRQGAGVTIAGDGSLSVTNAGIFGINQTWQDVTTSRTLGAVYTNSTGRPIMVMINAEGNRVSGTFTIGTITKTITNIDWTQPYTFVVPTGASYSFDLGGPTAGFFWIELR
jgi:hypothetical protein